LQIYDATFIWAHCGASRRVTNKENNSDRFMIGSDLCGHYEKLGKTLARYNALIKSLSPEKASDVLCRNAEKIWFKN
jgi:predicted TIM-barrel fold metal-dependent hydrolase